MTAVYSNAVLVAVLPHFSDVAKKLDLPIAQPITTNQVIWLSPLHIKGRVGCGVVLTNHYWFQFTSGYVASFRSPDDWFAEQDPAANVSHYIGKDNMTTNEAIKFARNSFRKLGCKPKMFHVDASPTKLEGPFDSKKSGHVPYCRIEWESPEATTREEHDHSYKIQFDIDMQRQQVVGMVLISTNFWRPPPKLDVETELESDYQKRISGKMFIRTNAPPHWPTNKPPDTE